MFFAFYCTVHENCKTYWNKKLFTKVTRNGPIIIYSSSTRERPLRAFLCFFSLDSSMSWSSSMERPLRPFLACFFSLDSSKSMSTSSSSMERNFISSRAIRSPWGATSRTLKRSSHGCCAGLSCSMARS